MARDPEYQRRKSLARYSLTIEEFDELLAAQGGGCAVCSRKDPDGVQWVVDHDHDCCPERKRSCGQCVRGILCVPCNVGISFLRDDPSRCRRAAAYLTSPDRPRKLNAA